MKSFLTATLLLSSIAASAQWFNPLSPGPTYTTSNVTRVGILNTNPQYELQVAGSISLDSTLDQRTFFAGPDVNDNPLIDWRTNQAMVNANFGGFLIQSTAKPETGVQNMLLGQNFDYRNNSNIRYRGNGASIMMQFVNGGMNMYTAAPGIAGNAITTYLFQPKINLANTGGFAIGDGPQLGNFAMQNAGTGGQLLVQNNIGLGTLTPSAQLHTTGSVRFEGLTLALDPITYVGADVDGNLFLAPAPSGGVQTSCFSKHTVPKSTVSGDLVCSQIFDDGGSVGIDETSNFAYSFITVGGSTSAPSSGTAKLAVNGVTMALAYYATSDERKKKNIVGLKNSLGLIKSLSGKKYQWNIEKYPTAGMDQGTQIGYLAQDLEKVVPEAVAKRADGSYAVNYNAIIPILSEGIKEQQVLIEEMKLELAELKTQLSALKSSVGNNNQTVSGSTKIITLNPNPASTETVIAYTLPSKSTAYVIVTDLQGKTLNRINVPVNNERGTLKLDTSKLPNGMYLVSMIVSGKEVHTEKMIVAN